MTLTSPHPPPTVVSTVERMRLSLASAVADARRPLGVYVLSRLAVLALAVLLSVIHPFLSVSRVLSEWDGGWYLRIVRDGYPAVIPEVGGQATQSPHAFFPLYPLATRGLSWLLPVSDAIAGMCISLLAGAVATVLLFRLACSVTDRRTAERAVTLFCFFPGSFVLSMVYAEGLTVALIAGCLLALVRRRWLAAGVLAGLATACRPNAIALIPVCMLAATVAVHRRREWRALLAPLLAPTGVMAFFAFLWARTGDPMAWFRVQHEAWGQQPGPGTAVFDLLRTLAQAPFADGDRAVVGLSLLFGVVALVVLSRQRWPGVLALHSVLVVGMSAMSRMDGLRPRFVLLALPVFIATAKASEGRGYRILLAGSAVGLVALFLLHSVFLLNEP
jgi:hypothetical protein